MPVQFISELIIRLFHGFKLRNPVAFLIVALVLIAFKAVLTDPAFVAEVLPGLSKSVQTSIEWFLIVAALFLGVHTDKEVEKLNDNQAKK